MRSPYLHRFLACTALTALALGARGQSDTQTTAQSSARLAWEITAGGKAEFDVASVKPSAPGTPFGSNVALDGTDGPPVGGLFRANAPVNAFLNFAFKISDSNQARSIYDKLPAWAKPPQFFEIEGRANGNPTRDQMRLMVQALLEDRFRLQIHREAQPRSVYALELVSPGKPGPELVAHPAEKPCISNVSAATTIEAPSGKDAAPYYCGLLTWSVMGQRHLQMVDMPMDQIVNYLASAGVLAMGAQVPHSGVNHTGLSGRFDMNIQFVPELSGPGSNDGVPGPRFTEALKKQLGLRLVDTTVPVEVFVIDRLEKPSQNN